MKSIEIVLKKIINIWKIACIPILTAKRIKDLLSGWWKKFKNATKQHKPRKDTPNLKNKLDLFYEKCNKLFDICSCKCKILNNRCSCVKDRKVPVIKQAFLFDQRNDRKMFITNIDCTTTNAIIRKEAGEIVRSASSCTKQRNPIPRTTSDNDSISLNIVKRNNILIPTLAETLDRCGVSDRKGAMIATAVLKDVGIVHTGDLSLVIDQSKVRRARIKLRSQNVIQNKNISINGLFFDGRKDKTLVLENKRRRTKVEEHIVLIQEPTSKFIGHVSPKDGSAKEVVFEINKFFETSNIKITDLQVIGCDGTAVNTGNKGGIITLIEQHLNRPLQWMICQLHANELPLRKLIEHLDGSTTGPKAFSGEIGKSLMRCSELPVCKFQPIESDLPIIVCNDLSTDQKYLYEMVLAVSVGNCSTNLSLRDPGKMVHSRWLTTANRILRVYVSVPEPSANLKTLCEFVVKVYAPCWFHIKTESSCVFGSKHVLMMVKLSRYLPIDLRNVVNASIQRNAYFAHHENILLAMLVDESQTIRELSIHRILDYRKNGISSRKFIIPKLNFDAESYYDLINWSDHAMTPPPIVAALSEEELWLLVNENGNTNMANIRLFPCHTQAVERAIQLVTEASISVCGEDQRNGFIMNKLSSRNKMPSFNTKRDFN